MMACIVDSSSWSEWDGASDYQKQVMLPAPNFGATSTLNVSTYFCPLWPVILELGRWKLQQPHSSPHR
jgi:hypothetical protein